MAKVELYFGAGTSGQRTWRAFVKTVVTPRFPDGLTTYDGTGQSRSRGQIDPEPSHVLVIYYRPTKGSDARIEEIRTLYRLRFRQRSVLRADSSACVGF